MIGNDRKEMRKNMPNDIDKMIENLHKKDFQVCSSCKNMKIKMYPEVGKCKKHRFEIPNIHIMGCTESQ